MDATTIKQQAAQNAAKLKQEAEEKLDQAGQNARKIGETVKAKASETASAVLDAAANGADAAKDALVLGGERLGGRLRDLAGDDQNGMQARLLGKAADGVVIATDTLRDHKFSDLADNVKGLARRHPGAFAAGAAVLGFALANYVRNSQRNARLAREVDEAGLSRHFRKGPGARS